jgi:magnesium-transporting ATPase (P-type)
MAEWHVARAGKTLGIYPEDAMRAYLAQGRVAPDDFVWTAGMPQWRSAREVFGDTANPPANVPLPPKLAWGWVLLLSIVTAGLFYVIWSFVQAVWVRRIDRESDALKQLIAYLVLTVIGEALTDAAGNNMWLVIVGVLISLIGMTVMAVAFFSMRRSLLAYYNNVEPIGLKLSWWMTLIFNLLYLQYHLTRIARRKEAASPQAAAPA